MSTPFRGVDPNAKPKVSVSVSISVSIDSHPKAPPAQFFLGAPKYDPSYREIILYGDLDLQGQGKACRGHHLKNHLN